MKTTAILVVAGLAAVLLILSPSCSPDYEGPVDGARALEFTRNIVDIGPRPPGSKNLRAVEDYLRTELKAMGLELKTQAFKAPAAVKAPDIEFRNLWVEIPGSDPNGPIIGIGAHYDSKVTDADHDFEFVGAIDAAGACALLLELAHGLSTAPEKHVRPNVWMIWFDGEESLDWEWGEGERALIGSKHFVKTMNADKKLFPNGLSRRMKVFVLLDLIGDKIQKIDKDTRSNGKLLDIFKATAESMGEGERMFRYESPMTDDHIPFRDYTVKVIDLIDFRWRVPTEHSPNMPEHAKQYTAWWHTPDDTIDQMSAESLGFVGSLVWNALPRIETEFYR